MGIPARRGGGPSLCGPPPGFRGHRSGRPDLQARPPGHCPIVHQGGDKDQAKYHKAQRVEDALRRWKGGLRPLKKQKNIERLEALSEESLSLQQVNKVIDNPCIWKDFRKTVRKVEDGGHISKEEKNLCVTVVLVMLLFKNWQRPGTVANLTTKEYRQAKPDMEGNREVLVIPIHDHKTQGKGLLISPAKVRK